jgi:hypothetical protein
MERERQNAFDREALAGAKLTQGTPGMNKRSGTLCIRESTVFEARSLDTLDQALGLSVLKNNTRAQETSTTGKWPICVEQPDVLDSRSWEPFSTNSKKPLNHLSTFPDQTTNRTYTQTGSRPDTRKRPAHRKYGDRRP